MTVAFVKKWADVDVDGGRREEGGAVVEMPLPYRLPPPKYSESGVDSGNLPTLGGRGRGMQISTHAFEMCCHCPFPFFSKYCPRKREGGVFRIFRDC